MQGPQAVIQRPYQQDQDIAAATKQVVFLVDRDGKRRHAVSQMLAGSRVVLPFESVAELTVRWPTDGLILLADEADNLTSCMSGMAFAGVCLPVVCYRTRPTTEQVFAAFCEEACGFVALPTSSADVEDELDRAIQRFEASRSGRERRSRTVSCLANLSLREREVLTLFIDGMCAKGSARALGLSPRTVELYRTNLTQKLRAKSMLHAAALALAAQ